MTIEDGIATVTVADGDAFDHAVRYDATTNSLELVAADGTIETISLDGVTAVHIVGGAGDDTIAIDSSDGSAPLSISFDGGDGSDSVGGPVENTTWLVDGAGAGSVAGLTFSGAEVLRGAGDNEDTFVFSAAVSMSIDGGSGGFDSLVIDTPVAEIEFRGFGPNDGEVVVNGAIISYTGLEPIVLTTTQGAPNIIVEATGLPDVLTIRPGGLGIEIDSATIEQVSFAVGFASLTVRGMGLYDSVTIEGVLDLGSGSLVVEAELIIVDSTAQVTTTGDITLTAADTIVGDLGVGLANCAFATVFDYLQNGFGFPTLGTHCAVAKVQVLDGGSLSGANVSLTAAASITPDTLAVLVPNSLAEVTITSTSVVPTFVSVAGTGNVVVSASSHIAVDVAEETVAGVLGLSKGAVKIDGTAKVTAGGTLQITSSSTIDNGSGGAATIAVTGSGSTSSSADAALAGAILLSTAASEVAGASSLDVTGALTIQATNAVDVNVTADTAGASAGAGVAIAVIVPTTTAAITTSGSIDAASITIKADANNRAVSSATARGGGADDNPDSTKSPDTRTKKPGATEGNANTSDGGISIAAALAFTYVLAETTASVAPSSGILEMTSPSGAQKLHVGARNRGSSNADGSPVSGNDGVAVGVAVTLADVTNRAFVDNEVTVTATSLTIEAVQPVAGPDTFSATAKSGVGDGGSVGVAGSLAVLIVDTPVDAVLEANTVLDVNGADVTLTATSTTDSTADASAKVDGGSGDTTGVGASVAINIVFDVTTAGLLDGSVLLDADDLTIVATTTDTMTTTIKSGAGGANAIGGGFATSFSTVETRASVGTSVDDVTTVGVDESVLSVAGNVNATATQTAAVTTTAEGAAQGSNVGIGVALALAVVEHIVESILSRDLTSVGGSASFRAFGGSTSVTTSKASVTGGENTDDQNGDTKQKADTQLTDTNTRASDNTGGKSSSSSTTPEAATGDSGNASVAVAGAISVNISTTVSRAWLADLKTVNVAGALTFAATANTDAKASADGSAVDAASAGVGVAVAVNFVDILNLAGLGVNTSTSSNGLIITAGMRNKNSESVHSLEATANAGAGSDKVGVAGALALNIVTTTTEAIVNENPTRGPPAVDAGNAAVNISATSTEKDVATATANAKAGTVGIGASIALNIIYQTKVRAEIENGATFTGGTTVMVAATGTRTVETTVEAGSSGQTAVTPAVALALDKEDSVIARIGTGSSTLTATGAVTVQATHTADLSKTSAKAKAQGSSAAVGADIAINVVLDWTTTAEIARDLTAGSVLVQASSTMTSSAAAEASAGGNSDSDSDADTKSNGQVANNPNTNDKGVGTLPSAGSETTSANSTSSSESGKSGGGVGVAAAIAVNWVVTTNTARIASNVTITANTGAVTVSARNHIDATAKATGLSADLAQGTSVGAAVGLNVADSTNTAVIDTDADVSGNGITVEAITPAGERNDYVVWGLAAAGGKGEASVAASVGVQVIIANTSASVRKGADLDSSGGVTVKATNSIGIQNLALAGGAQLGGTAVGGAISVTVLEPVATKAYIDSGTAVGDITRVDAAGAISVTATTTIVPLQPDGVPKIDASDLPAVSAVAVAGGAGTGSAAVTGAVVVDVFDLQTHAYIGNGARVNQDEDPAWTIGSGQTLNVAATHSVDVIDVAGSLSLTTGSAGVGVSVVVHIINNDVRAYIGNSALVEAQGNASITATTTEELFALVISGAASGGTTVVGSFAVAVMNQGGGSPGTYASVGTGSELHSNGNVTISASDTADKIELYSGNLAFGSTAGVGVSVAVLVRAGRVDAKVGQNASIESKGAIGLAVSATQVEDIVLLAAGGAGGNTAGIAGSAVVDVLSNDTLAHIDAGATVNGVNTGASSTQGVKVTASDTTDILGIAGTVSVGGTASVGAGVDVEVVTKNTKAWIGADATVNANGDVTVDADSSESVTSIAVGGGFGGSVAVNVNATVSVFNITTQAYVAHGANAADGVTITANGSVRIAADEALDIDLIAGNVSGGGAAAVGAGAAVPVITKTTTAYIGDFAQVTGKGGGVAGVAVKAGAFDLSQTDTRFNGANVAGNTIDLGHAHGFEGGEQVMYDNGGGTSIGGLTDNGVDTSGAAGLQSAVYYVIYVDATRIKLSDTPGGPEKALAPGSGIGHRIFDTREANVRKDESQRFDSTLPGVVSGSTLTLPYAHGLSVDDAVVYTSGGGTPIGGLEDGGTYYVVSAGVNTLQLAHEEGGSAIAFSSAGSGTSHSIVESGNLPAADPSSFGPRTISNPALPTPFRGVAVTATNSDDIAGIGIAAGFAGSAAVNLSGVVNVTTVNTSAFIGKSAKVNCTLVSGNCTNPGAHGDQSVRVAAGNNYFELGVVASLAIAGGAGVGVGAGVRILDLNADAYVDDSARVKAARDVVIAANSKEKLVSVVAAAGGGTVGVAGTVTVTVLDTHTYANTGMGVTIEADDNVLISARDDLEVVMVTASLAGGFVGVGVAVGVMSVTKDTQAYIGANSKVDAKALDAGSTVTAYNGNYQGFGFATSNFRGVAVQAASSEDVFGLAASAGGGFVGVAGGVGVTLLDVTTKAYVSAGAQVNNNLAGASGAQSVNVSAVDAFRSLTVAGGIAGGFVGASGGVDIGIADISTQASLDDTSVVHASANVDVNALSLKRVKTYALSAAGGFVGVAVAVSVWTVGTDTTSTFHDGAAGPNKGAWSGATTYNEGDVVTYDAGDGVKLWGSKGDGNLGHTPGPGSAFWQGEQDAFSNDTSGNPAGDADFAASGNDANVNSKGYRSVLDGTSDSGNPDVTNQRMVTQINGADGTLQARAPGGSLASSKINATPTLRGTAAYIGGTVVAGGSVHVRAKEDAQVDGIAGAVGIGLVGAGGSVLVLNVQTKTTSRIGTGGDVTAGPSGAVTLETNYVEDVDALAFAGAGGAVALFAQVAVVNVDSTQQALIDSGADIRRAGGGVAVTSTANRNISTLGIGGGVGLGAIGASVAIVNASGNTEAKVGSVTFGATGAVGAITVTADDPLTATSFAINVAGGLGVGLGAAVSVVDIGGTTVAEFGGSNGTGSVGAVTVTALGNHTAQADTFQVTSGAFAAGVIVAKATNGRSTEASITGAANFSSSGLVHVKADASNTAKAKTPGASVGGLAVSVMVPIARVSGATRARLQGTVRGSTGVTVEALGSNTATSTAQVFSIAIAGLSGVVATAEITSNAKIEALFTGSITSTGAVRIEAKAKGANTNKVQADIESNSFGAFTGGAFVGDAKIRGAVRAEVSGSITTNTTVDVLATSSNDARSSIEANTISGFGASVAGASASITSDAETEVFGTSAGSIDAGGAIHLTATSVNFAKAFSDAATGGILAGITISLPEAIVNAATRVEFSGDVTNGDSIEIKAKATNTADAASKAISVSFGIAASGGGSEARIGDGADTEAIVGSQSSINGISGNLVVTAVATNIATAKSGGQGGGGIDIKIIHPDSKAEGDTTAALNGSVGTTAIDPVLGIVGVAGAFDIEVSARANDATFAAVDTFGIGLVAVSASSATAITAPTVSAKLGSGNVTATNNVLVFADSQTDADAFADASSGGILNIQAELVADARVQLNSNSDPTASALVEGGFVQAGNTLTISANHGGPVPELSDGTIQSVQTLPNTLTFALPHGVETGDVVVYSAPAWPGPAPSASDVENGLAANPNAIGGLGDGRTYGVIVTGTTTLQLGVEFNAAGVVDTARGALTFAQEHNFETGDRVVYDCNGGGAFGTQPAAGLICGQPYYVYKVDEFAIRLSTVALPDGGTTVYTFDPNGAAGANVTVASTAGLVDGQALVYHAPAVIEFTSQMVDIKVDGDGKLIRTGSGIDHSENNNKIYAYNHAAIGFTTGVEVVYTVEVVTTDPTPPAAIPIGGLSPGVHYWVFVDGADPHRIRLADSECHAGIGTYDPTPGDPGNGDENTLCSTNIQLLSLTPDFSNDAQKTIHTLRRADRPAIFTEGSIYIVDVINATTFRLLDPVTLSPVVPFSGGNSNGSHRLVNEGIAVISNGTGTQRLIVDLTSSGTGTPHVLAGIGGPESLLGAADGVVSATSTGIGGGLFDLRDATSYTYSKPKVEVSAGAATLRGEDIIVGSASQANVAVASVGLGGGFASFGESNANADVTNTVHTTIASGADLFATHNIQITSEGVVIANGKGVNATGGLIAGADVDITLKIGYDVKTTVDGTVVANRTLLIDAAAGFDARTYARASSGGLGTNADANDDSSQGIRIGVNPGYGALVETRIVDGAELRAKLFYGSAGVGVSKSVNLANGAVTSTALLAKADGKSTVRAAALGADSDSAAYVRYTDVVRVVLEGGTEIEGDAVTLRAAHENVDLKADATASCACGGGDTDATASIVFHLDSRVQADDGSVIRTAALLVEAISSVGYYAHARKSGGLLDGGDADADVTVDPKRTIVWNADVYLLGEPNPLLIVDGNGKIVAKSDNVIVRANGVGPALQIDDVFAPGTTIVIDPIIYDQEPTALFRANKVDANPSTISGTLGVFYMQETWNSVRILNGSDRAMQMLATVSGVSINVLNSSMSSNPESVINISVDDGAELLAGLPFRFDVKHIFPATDVRVESKRGPPSMTACAGSPCNLTIFGDIYNIVGTTTIRNDRGNILAGPAGPVFHSNRAYLDAELGSVGTIPVPVRLVLYQITHTGVVGVAATYKDAVLDAEAGTDMYLEVAVIRRSSTTASNADVAVLISNLKAGRDLYVKVNDSSEGTDPAVVGTVNVDIYTPNNLPPAGGAGHTRDESVPTINHFRPDVGTNPDIVGCGTSAPCVILVAFGNALGLRNANYLFQDIAAGNRIGIHHPSTATEITYTTFIDGDAVWVDDETGASHGTTDDVGKIDMSTNGFIWVIEAEDDLRVGHINSTGICSNGTLCPGELAADVILDSPRRIIDAELLDSVAIAQDDDDDATCVDPYDVQWGYDCGPGTANGVDVSAGRHIIMTAGDNGIGGMSGTGGIGMPFNYLEVNVDTVAGGTLGRIDADDLAADDDDTFGIYLDEVAGDMNVGLITTAGDIDLFQLTGNVSLRTRAGSIIDALNDSAADVLGQTIDIDANGGSIGQVGNDLEIDSSRGSSAPCVNLVHPRCADTTLAVADPGLAATNDDVALEATGSIYLTEVDAYLRLLFAHAVDGDIRITVRDSADLDEDLYLIEDGFARFAEDNTTLPGNDIDSLRPVPIGTVLAETGSVTLRAGDNVATYQHSQIVANGGIQIYGDFHFAGPDPDVTYGTNMVLRGRIVADAVVTKGPASGDPMGTYTPNPDPPVGHLTEIFGNNDIDQIQFGDQSGIPTAADNMTDFDNAGTTSPGYIFLGSKTVVRGSDEPTLTATVTGASRAGNVATITTSAAHGFTTGRTVTVRGVGSGFDGTYLITGVGATTFTYANTGVGAAIVVPAGANASSNQADLGHDDDLADGEDVFTVYYLQSADVLAAPAQLTLANGFNPPAAGHSLTLDGQADTDYYRIYTTGSRFSERNYVINVLDTGYENDGVDELDIYGRDNHDPTYNGYVPGTTERNPNDDLFLLRAVKCIDTDGDYGVGGAIPTSCDSPTEVADQPAMVALLHGDATGYKSRVVGDEPSNSVQRIHYDAAVNGRVAVYGFDGNDEFYVDDTTANMTLDGGEGFDHFQIGQIFGTKRDQYGIPNPAIRRLRRGRPAAAARHLPGADRHHPWLAQPGHARSAGRDRWHRQRRVRRVLQPGRAAARGPRRQRPVHRAGVRPGGGVRHGRRRRWCLRLLGHRPRRRPQHAALSDRRRTSGRDDTGQVHSGRTPELQGRGLEPEQRPRLLPVRQQRRRNVQHRRRPHHRRSHVHTEEAGRPDDVGGRRHPARRGRRRPPDHRARLLDRPPARHPGRWGRGRGLLQRQRTGVRRRRHRLRQAGRAGHRVRRRHRHHVQGDLRRRTQRALHHDRGRRDRRARG